MTLVTIQFRRGSAAAWTSANPVLHLGEPGLDTTSMRLKLGDGVTAWEDLEWTTPTPAQMAQLIELLEEAGDLDDGRMTNVVNDVDSDFYAAILSIVGTQVPSASTTAQGKVELATNTEAAAGADTARALTPGGLRYALANGQIAYDLTATIADTVNDDASLPGIAVREVIADEGVASFGKPLRNVSSRGLVGENRSNGTDLSQTSRLRFLMRGGAGWVRLVFVNFYLPAGSHEPSNAYNVTVKASIEDPSVSTGSPTGASVIPVFFGGQRSAIMAASGVLISDPVYINAADDAPIFVRSYASVTSGDRFPTPYVSQWRADAGTDTGGSNEGVVVNTDSVDSGTIGGSNSFAFGPVALVTDAITDDARNAVIVAGDSLAQGAGLLKAGAMSYLARAVVNAGLPLIRIPEGSEQAIDVLNPMTYWKRMQLARYARHVVHNHSINDVIAGKSLAQMKANAILEAQIWARYGVLCHQATILPHPGASTDGYLTAANQSIVSSAQETVRTGFNTWLRSGQAVIDSAGAIASVIDVCQWVECNSAGVLTTNGGRWLPAGVAAVVSGTATGVSTSSLTDTTKARTSNQDRSLVLAILTATTGSGQVALVQSNNTTTVWTLTSITLPTGTVTYQIAQAPVYDHLHITEYIHELLGDAINLTYLKAM